MRRGIVAAILLVLGVASHESRAGYLTVVNPGFESPGQEYINPTGWTEDQKQADFLDYESLVKAPSGMNVGSWSAFTQGDMVASGSQVIANFNIGANSTYTLDALVGGRGGGFPFGGATIELFDATTTSVLASFTLNLGSDNPGFFQLESAVFSTGQAGGPIGDQLGIRLIGLAEGGGQSWFDNVSVQQSPSVVPEPSSLVMLGMGAVGLLGYLRCQARASANPARVRKWCDR